MKTSLLPKNLVTVPRASFCNSQQHRFHLSSLSHIQCLSCVLSKLIRTSKEGVQRAEGAVTALIHRGLPVFPWLWHCCEILVIFSHPSAMCPWRNFRRCRGHTGSVSAPQQHRLCRWQRFHIPLPQDPKHFPAMLLRSITLAMLPRVLPQQQCGFLSGCIPVAARAELPTPSSWKSQQLCVKCSKVTLCSNLAGGPSQTCLPKNKRESFETPVVSVQRKNVSWQGERGSGRKTYEALQAVLLDAALWHMWEMLVVLILAPGLSQALASSRAQGAFPFPFFPCRLCSSPQQSSLDTEPREESLLQTGKPKQGAAATFLRQRQEEGSETEDLLCSRESCSSEGEQDSSGYWQERQGDHTPWARGHSWVISS